MSQCQKVSGMTVHHRLHRNGWNCLITMVHPNRTQRRPVPLSQLQLSSENTSSCVTVVVVTSCHVWSSGLSTLTPCHGYTKSRWRRCLCRLPVHQWNGSLAVKGYSCARTEPDSPTPCCLTWSSLSVTMNNFHELYCLTHVLKAY